MEFIKEISKKNEALKEYYEHDGKNFLKDAVASFLGAVIPYAPIYAFYENILPKMLGRFPDSLQFLHDVLPDMGEETSKVLKIYALPIVGIGGYVLDKARLFSRSKFKKKSFWTHDIPFSYANSFTNFVPYIIGFDGKVKETFTLTFGSGPISILIGSISAYTTDILKNLFNFKPNSKSFPSFEIPNRLPKFIDKASSKAKYGIAGLMVATSAILTWGVYEYSSSISKNLHDNREIELNNLERHSLDESFPEFNRNSLKSYSVPLDGLKIDTPKYFKK
ncbi:hypothetical protein J4411_01725 [Candidatus Pacearchaeota archaeon]|nr:hypothetical protein [Candidatus Pacearchaeota archaeon]